jgi:hypothetical protein
MGYKEAPLAEERQRCAGQVDALCAWFLSDHARCVAAAAGQGLVDLVLPVPSTSRPGGSPLDRVNGLPAHVEEALAPTARWSPLLLQRTRGTIGHMRPNAAAFAVPPSARSTVAGARILLVDDTYVSGARAQSAAAALRRAGARATVIVPLGRLLRPDRSSLHAAFLVRSGLLAGGESAGAARCCRCVQTAAPTS